VALQIDTTRAEIHGALARAQQHYLDSSDWPLVCGLLEQLAARVDRRQDRMAAKAAAGAADAESASDDDASVEREGGATESTPSESTPENRATDGGSERETEGASPEKPKGHGRNGASAFRTAEHILHVLAGVIGAVCEVCGFGKMYRYREKVIIRVIGQPMFFAEAHHYEQARCRECGHIARAPGPACVHEGVGSDYVRLSNTYHG